MQVLDCAAIGPYWSDADHDDDDGDDGDGHDEDENKDENSVDPAQPYSEPCIQLLSTEPGTLNPKTVAGFANAAVLKGLQAGLRGTKPCEAYP